MIYYSDWLNDWLHLKSRYDGSFYRTEPNLEIFSDTYSLHDNCISILINFFLNPHKRAFRGFSQFPVANNENRC